MPNPPANLVLVGVFGAAVGLKGEVRLKSYTGDPQAIAGYNPLQTQDGRRFEILSVRPQKDMLVARVRGIEDRTAAERLVNLKLYASRAVFGATAVNAASWAGSSNSALIVSNTVPPDTDASHARPARHAHGCGLSRSGRRAGPGPGLPNRVRV